MQFSGDRVGDSQLWCMFDFLAVFILFYFYLFIYFIFITT